MDHEIGTRQCISNFIMVLNQHMPAMVIAVILILSVGLIYQWGQRASAFSGINGNIVFTRDDQIYMYVDGHIEQLTGTGTDGTYNRYQHWSPDGNEIAFTSNRDGKREIYIMNIKDRNVKRVTFDQDDEDWEPSWSPDGTKLVFSSSKASTPDQRRDSVFVLNLITGVETQLTFDICSSGAVWSPDGKKIAFHSSRDIGILFQLPEIYIMNADGTEQTRLTHNEWGYGCNAMPCWSPDGTKIAFAAIQGSGVTKICTIDPVPGAMPSLPLTGGTDWEYFPCWSPDGKKIAFTRQRGGGLWSMAEPRDIYVLDLESGIETLLIENGWEPEWQPLGKITFSLSTDSIYKGQSITALGSIIPSRSNVPITLAYTRPDGSTVYRSATTTTDGMFTDTYSPDEYGQWNVKASWPEWAVESPSIQFRVKIKTTLFISTPTSMYVGNDTVISGYISPALSGAQIIIQIIGPSNTTSFATTQNGQFNISYVPVRGGTYSVQAIFDGDAEHSGSQSSVASLKVMKLQTSLVLAVSESTFPVGNSVLISGNISPAFSGALIHVQIRGRENMTESMTTLNGQFSLSYAPSKAGNYMVQAIYDGDYERGGSQSSIASFEVQRIPTSITVSASPSEGSIDVLTGSATPITISGRISPGIPATIYISMGEGQGPTMVATSDGGDFTLSIIPRVVGTSQITATYMGSDNYKPSVNYATITMVQNYTTLIVVIGIVVTIAIVAIIISRGAEGEIGEIKREIEKYRNYIDKLESNYKEGKIEKSSYDRLKKDYESKLKDLEEKNKRIIDSTK